MKAVNKERMLAEFKEIVAIPCHTLKERPVFELLRTKLEALGFTAVTTKLFTSIVFFYGKA